MPIGTNGSERVKERIPLFVLRRIRVQVTAWATGGLTGFRACVIAWRVTCRGESIVTIDDPIRAYNEFISCSNNNSWLEWFRPSLFPQCNIQKQICSNDYPMRVESNITWLRGNQRSTLTSGGPLHSAQEHWSWNTTWKHFWYISLALLISYTVASNRIGGWYSCPSLNLMELMTLTTGFFVIS